MTGLALVLVFAALAAAGWFWISLFRTEKPVFRCVGCGKCIAAGECVLMREERERQLKLQMQKTAAKNGENPRDPS